MDHNIDLELYLDDDLQLDVDHDIDHDIDIELDLDDDLDLDVYHDIDPISSI